MLYSFLLFVVAVALACYAGASYAWRVAKDHIRDSLASSEAKMEQQLRRENPGGCLHEAFTMGWINLLLQTLWIPILEKHIAGLTAELLRKVFNEVHKKHADKVPWSLIESIAVEELTFGTCPPKFENALAIYDPATSVLSIGMDAEVVSSSAQAVLMVKTKPMPLLGPSTVRLEATRVSLKGRLKLGIVFGTEPPGIAGIYYSFMKPPSLHISIRPLGTPLPPQFDVGLADALQKALKGIISRRMVEPQRRFFDLQRMYLNRHVARIGGPGGLVRIHVQFANRLYRKYSDPQTQPRATPVKHSTYCLVKLVGQQQQLRTPVAHSESSSSAVWCWQLAFALPVEPTAAAMAAGQAVHCSLSVFSSQTVGEPVLLAKGKVCLSTLNLVPNTAPKPVTVPLHGAGSKDATLQLEVTWLKSTKQQQGAQGQATHEQRQREQQQPSSQNSSNASVATGPVNQSLSARSSPVASAAASPAGSGAGQAAGAPGKSVSWHDVKFRQLLEAEAAENHTAIAAGSEPSSLRQHQPPRLGSSSPVGSVQLHAAPSAAGSSSKNHRRSTTLDLSTLPGNRDAMSGSSTPRRASTATAEADQQLAAAGDSTVVLNPRQLQQQDLQQRGPQEQEQQLLSPTGSSNWLWPNGSSWGSWLSFSGRQPATGGGDTHADGLGASKSGLTVTGAQVPASAVVPSSGGTTQSAGGAGVAYSAPTTPAGGGSAADNSRASSPLAMLASAVQMQRQTEQQQQQVAALQRQLADVMHREQQLQQQMHSSARAALLQGGRFLLHGQDGTAHHVLLYLSQQPAPPAGAVAGSPGQHSGSSSPSSSRSGGVTAAGAPSQQSCLVVAALPSCKQAGCKQQPSAEHHHALSGTISKAATKLHLLRSSVPGSGGCSALESGAGTAAAEAAAEPSNSNPISRRFAKRQRKQLAKLAYEPAEYLRDSLPRLQVVAVSSLLRVQQGTQLLQEQRHSRATGAGCSRARDSSGEGQTGRCPRQLDIISVVFTAAGGGGEEVSLLLQVPPVGNGRTTAEWLYALQQLMCLEWK